MRSSYEVRKADDGILFRIVEDRLRNYPYIRELYTDDGILKIISKKKSLDNELLTALVLDNPVYFQLLSNINKNLETLYSDGVIKAFKLKFQNWDLNSFSSTVVELYFAAVFKKRGYSIQFEPELPNGQRSEFLAKKGDITCYVEEKTIHREKTQKERWVSDELIDKLDNIDEPFALSIEITDHMEKKDADDIVKYIRERLREEQSITNSFKFIYEKGGVGLAEITAERLLPDEKGYVSGFLYPGLMTIDWSDLRNKISRKISQLHPDYPGILVIHPLTIDIDLYDIFNALFGDLAVSLKDNKNPVRLQNRILKRNKNSRISAIIIHRKKTNINGYDIENIVIFNRYADKPLPRDFLDFTSNEFKTLEQYNEELLEIEKQKQNLIQTLCHYGIEKKANYYKANGWQVKANIDKWIKPDPINGFTPDIVAIKENKTLIIQINTCLTLLDRMAQESNLKSYAQRAPNTKFLHLIVDLDKTIKTEKKFNNKYLGSFN
jgi:hypothetical protein